MPAATVLLIALILATPMWIRAQTTALGTGAPETLSATAESKNATGSFSGMFELRMLRYMSDFDRQPMEAALRRGGYPQFLAALGSAPEFGQLVIGDGQAFSIRYARERVFPGGRTLVLVTNTPVFLIQSARDGAKRAGYQVAVVEIQMDGSGQGRGRMTAAARVRPDGDGGVLLDDYIDQPIVLTSVTRKPI